MRNYDAHDIKNHFNKYNDFYQFYVVVHSKFHPRGQSQYCIDRHRKRLSDKLNKTLKLLISVFHPNFFEMKFKDKKLARMLTFTTVEGLSPDDVQPMTTHFNIAIGNLPAHVTKEIFEKEFLKIWHKQFGESNDFWIASKNELVSLRDPNEDPMRAVNGYAVKDGYKNKSKSWSTDGFLDVENCWIPHEALVLK